jgi:cell division septum initiation protein DivIVA
LAPACAQDEGQEAAAAAASAAEAAAAAAARAEADLRQRLHRAEAELGRANADAARALQAAQAEAGRLRRERDASRAMLECAGVSRTAAYRYALGSEPSMHPARPTPALQRPCGHSGRPGR